MTGAERPAVGLMLATVANTDTGRVEPTRAIEAARCAEAAGFDGVFVGDHLLHPHPLLDSVVTLSAVASATERISLGPCTRATERLPARLFAAGSPDEVVEQLHRYWELGCTELVLGPADQGDGYLEQVDLLAKEVLPAVHAFG